MAADNKVDVQVGVSVTGQEDLGALSQQLDQTGQHARQLGQQGQTAGTGLDAAATAARGAGQAGGQAAAGAQAAAQGLAQAGGAAGQAAGKLGETRQGLQSISVQLAGLQGKLESTFKDLAASMTGLFAASKVKDFVASTIDLADAYGQMAERIKMATPAAGEYATVQQRILESANLTYRPLQEQQELYIRTADALRSLSYNTAEALDITDSFSYLLTTNAASSERAASAIGAYTKSIQSGRVDALSWQSILAAMPTVVDAIATATGKTAAEIRQMGITGNLAVRDLNEGLRQSVEVNKQAAADMSATVSDAMTRLQNTWQAYVGQANQASGATQDIVKVIDLLSEHLDAVVSLAVKAGEVMAAVWAAKALGALKEYIASLVLAQKETATLAAGSVAAAGKAGGSWAQAAQQAGGAWALAGKMAMAAWIGWEIGTYLGNEFKIARDAGILMSESLVKCGAYVQSAWELVKATFSRESYAQALDKINKRMAEINTTFAQMYKDAGGVAEAQNKAAAATQQAGSAAGKAAADWARLQQVYKDTTDQIQKYGQLLQQTAAARNAEAQTAVRLANAFGDETQKRQAAASAAQVQAEQAQRLAGARASEVAAMESQRAAILSLDEGYRNATKEVQDQLKELDEAIALRSAEAQAAGEQARQSGIAAAQAQAEAEALKDNSARVDELRAAHEAAHDAYLLTSQAYRDGKATLEDVGKAEQELVKTTLLYKDALADKRAALAAAARAEQAGLTVQEQSLRVAAAQQQAIYEVCKARGDERGAMTAQNNIRKLEIELLELQAQAKRAEAQAQLAAVEAQRAELIASGQYTEQKRLELDAATKAAQVKSMEADIAGITAGKLRDLAAAETEAGDAAGRASGGHQRNTDAINKEADAAERLQRIGGGGGGGGGEDLTTDDERRKGITHIKGPNGQDIYTNKAGQRVTQDGWAADGQGRAIAGKSDLGSLTGIYNFLKSAGVNDDATARGIALEFADSEGKIPFFNNPGLLKYRKTKYDDLSTALLYAAEQYTFGPGGGAADGPAAVPASAAAPVPGGAARTVNVNLNLNGKSYGQVPTDDSGAASLQALMRALEDAKRAGGY